MSTIDLTQAWQESHGGTFITGEEKQKIHTAQAPIYVYDVEPRVDGQFGEQTVFHVRSNADGAGDMRLLAFSHTNHRERFAASVKMLLAAAPNTPGGPLYLHKFRTNNGNEAWDLKPTKQTELPTPAAPAKPESAPKPARDLGDDLPF